MNASTAQLETSILERLVVSPSAAHAIIDLKFTEDDQQRMQTLIDKNNEGTISDAEKEEMETYSRVGSFLGILQSKARLHLQQATDG